MKCYAVVDTNIIVSALINLHSQKQECLSHTSEIMRRIISGEIVTVYSDEILNEYDTVLHRSKFRFDEKDIQIMLKAITKSKMNVTPSSTGTILPDMKDLPFYEVVMEKRSDNAYLVTGNVRHFPKEPFIVTARQMLDILDGREITEN